MTRFLLVVEERIGIANRLGKAADGAALDIVGAGLAGGADLLACFVVNNLVRH